MPDALTPRILRPSDEKALTALARIAMPGTEQVTTAVDEADVVTKVGLSLAAMSWEARLGFRVGLAAFSWLSFFRYLRTFPSLRVEQQERWMALWAHSPLLLAKLNLRMLLTMIKPVHVGRRLISEQMGYDVARLDGVRPKVEVELPSKQLFPLIRTDTEVRCQVAVVGSGAGGAVVAAELAERGIDVVIVEEGRVHTVDELGHDPEKAFRETYRDGGATVALGRPAIPIPLGMTVGGSTTINSGTCFRTPERVFQRWDEMGFEVDRAAMDRHFRKVEERINVQEVPPHLLGGSSQVIARGAEQLGLDHAPLKRNIRGCQQSSVCVFGCPRTAKQSSNVS